jgi:hypothetical protein
MESNKYISPSITLQEYIPEGVLCASGDLPINDWEREDGIIEF